MALELLFNKAVCRWSGEKMGFWAEKIKERKPKEERLNRQGNWVRAFSFSKDPWGVIEHWASEKKYHLVAFRGDRRLYQKDFFFSHYQAFLDIKQEANSVSMSLWINVSFLLRLLTLFQLPQTITLVPSGFWGIRIRRHSCREINQLLFRFRQPSIQGTLNFHWADLELSTLLLLGSFSLPLVAFLLFTVKGIEIFPALSPQLLSLIGFRFVWLLVLALGVTALQHWLSRRWMEPITLQGVSAVLLFSVFTTSSVLLITHTSRGLIETRWGFHCLQRPNGKNCETLTQQLDEKTRTEIIRRLEILEKDLASTGRQ